MGLVDMTCGFHAPTPEGTYNVHFIGVEKVLTAHTKIPSIYLSKLREKLAIRAIETSITLVGLWQCL